MAQNNIPDDVRRFILTCISTIPFLEAMLLMRSDSDVLWDRKKLAQRLYVSEKRAEELLAELQSAGFTVPDESNTRQYRFQPSSHELDIMCGRLAEAYSTNIIAVANLVHSKVARQAQQFADAFKWRKD